MVVETGRAIDGQIHLWKSVLTVFVGLLSVLLGVFFMFRRTWMTSDGVKMRTLWVCNGKPVVLTVSSRWSDISRIDVEPIFKDIVFFSSNKSSTHDCSPQIMAAGLNVVMNRRDILRFIGDRLEDLDGIDVDRELLKQIERATNASLLERWRKSFYE